MALQTKKKPQKLELSDKTKTILVATMAGVALIGGGWWAYLTFTTVAPPPLAASAPPETAAEVATYLGDERGFGRLSVDQQEQYLFSAFQTFGRQPEARTRFNQTLRQMSTAERQVLNDAVFEIGRKHVMKHAEVYANLPPSQRAQYIDKAIQGMETMRTEIGGGGSSGSLSDPLRDSLPTRPEEMMKAIYIKTNPAERAKATPFIEAVGERLKAQKRK